MDRSRHQKQMEIFLFRIYEYQGNNWKFHSETGTTRMQRYKITNKILQSKPASASLLASVNHGSNGIVLTSKVYWNFTTPDEDPIYADYESGPFDSIEEAFKSSIDRKQILINKYKLPKDQCLSIAEGIQCGIARAISDGSFDCIDQLGTSALIIVANKKGSHKLNCWNWVPGVKEDQNSYRNKLAGINGILATISIFIHYFNIT